MAHLSAEATVSPREFNRHRLLARTSISAVNESERATTAASFVHAAFRQLATIVAPELPLRSFAVAESLALEGSLADLAAVIGKQSAQFPLEVAAHQLTTLYSSMLSPTRRSELGAFYTPPCLTGRLLDIAEAAGLDWATARVLDPASGGGAFLAAASRRMRAAMDGMSPAAVVSTICRNLRGLEIDASAAWFAQTTLELQLADLTLESGVRATPVIMVCDTLEATPTEIFDLVVGNPPYGRVTLSPEQRGRFRRSLYGHANLYGVFTDIALRWASPSGLVAFLTPTSVLGGQYFSALRTLLANEAPPVSLDFVDARKGVFEDALQETMLAVYRKDAERGPVQVSYIEVKSDAEAIVTRNGTFDLPPDASAPWMAPRSARQAPLLRQAATKPTRLADWGYRVSTGPLVWNRFKASLRSKPQKGAFPILWSEAVTSDGRFSPVPERRNRAPYFAAGAGDDWLIGREPCVLLQRTTAKEQQRRLIAAELPAEFLERHGGAVVENHLNMVRAVGRPLVSPGALAAALNSDIIDQVFRCISGSVAVSAFELEALPLPSVEDMQVVEALVAASAPRSDIDRALAACYHGEGGE